MRYLFVLLILAGCASWQHPTKDERDLKADRYECQRDAIAISGGLLALSLIDACMEGRGWTR